MPVDPKQSTKASIQVKQVGDTHLCDVQALVRLLHFLLQCQQLRLRVRDRAELVAAI